MDFGKTQEQWNFQKLKLFKNKIKASPNFERSFLLKN